MATSLEAKLEFKELCDILENIKLHKIEKKVQILQTFIDKCRNISNKLKEECPESVCSMLILTINNLIMYCRMIIHIKIFMYKERIILCLFII